MRTLKKSWFLQCYCTLIRTDLILAIWLAKQLFKNIVCGGLWRCPAYEGWRLITSGAARRIQMRGCGTWFSCSEPWFSRSMFVSGCFRSYFFASGWPGQLKHGFWGRKLQTHSQKTMPQHECYNNNNNNNQLNKRHHFNQNLRLDNSNVLCNHSKWSEFFHFDPLTCHRHVVSGVKKPKHVSIMSYCCTCTRWLMAQNGPSILSLKMIGWLSLPKLKHSMYGIFTPLKFNMEPENQPLEKEIPIGNHHFEVPC